MCASRQAQTYAIPLRALVLREFHCQTQVLTCPTFTLTGSFALVNATQPFSASSFLRHIELRRKLLGLNQAYTIHYSLLLHHAAMV